VTSQKSSKDLNRASNCSTPLLICNIEESNRKQANWMLKIMGGDIQRKFKHALCKEWFGTSHKRKLALMFLQGYKPISISLKLMWIIHGFPFNYHGQSILLAQANVRSFLAKVGNHFPSFIKLHPPYFFFLLKEIPKL